MSWLARLKKQPSPDPEATKPTKPAGGHPGAGFVGFVAYPPAPFQVIDAHKAAANDTPVEAMALDPDRCCWPNSVALSGQEIDTLIVRLALFTDKGVSLDGAERLADGLVIRDRESDDRRLCLECDHLQGHGHWRCGNWLAAAVAQKGLAQHLVTTLQRCSGFTQTPNTTP